MFFYAICILNNLLCIISNSKSELLLQENLVGGEECSKPEAHTNRGRQFGCTDCRSMGEQHSNCTKHTATAVLNWEYKEF